MVFQLPHPLMENHLEDSASIIPNIDQFRQADFLRISCFYLLTEDWLIVAKFSNFLLVIFKPIWSQPYTFTF